MKIKPVVVIIYLIVGMVMGVHALIILKRSGESLTLRGIIASLIVTCLFWPIIDLIDTILCIRERITKNRKG